jgi:DNA topoisomerase-6 subunit B
MARDKAKKAPPAKPAATGKKPAAKAGKKPAKTPPRPADAVEEAPAPAEQADEIPIPPDDGASEDAESTESPTDQAESKAPRSRYATAETMAKAQRSISVSEFFAKNRHLLGFDNPRKALLTAVKEAVDNSLDACEEAGILPRVEIWIEQVSETHFRITVQDNGPGIVRKQIPNIFGKLLYGSKFHRLRMSRGQQGIGISAAGMYGVLTTGVPVKITSRTGPRMPAHYYELQIDTSKNRPDVSKEDAIEWDCPHGTRVAIELEARYQRGRQSVDDYLEQTAIANPHVTLVYHQPDGQLSQYDASVDTLPPLAKAIRPHPYGIELGVLMKMLGDSASRTAKKFLTAEFSRVSPRVAKDILDKADVELGAKPNRLGNESAKRIYHAIQEIKIMAPATDCVVPVGEEQLISGLRQVVDAAFYVGTTRSPAVYRGNPFIIEAALAYGRPEAEEGQAEAAPAPEEAQGPATAGRSESLGVSQAAPGAATGEEDDEDHQLARLMRFANRVPLLYQQSACSIYKSVVGLNWKSYGLPQGRGALPTGPLTIVVHMASVWVPFTSESKEAIASYPEILKEIRLALQDCGRKLGLHIRKGIRQKQELKKRTYIEKYIPAIGEALRDILDLKAPQVTRVCADLKEVLEKSRRF